jgi:hypothetical protein
MLKGQRAWAGRLQEFSDSQQLAMNSVRVAVAVAVGVRLDERRGG